MTSPAISLTQPWAYFMTQLPPEHLKRIENRGWNTKVRGSVWVHASKKMTADDYHRACAFARSAGVPISLLPPVAALQRGGIVGLFSIVDVIRPGGVYDTGTAHPLGRDRWYMGEYGFVVKDAEPVPFTPCAGALGFWRVPPGVLQALADSKKVPP